MFGVSDFGVSRFEIRVLSIGIRVLLAGKGGALGSGFWIWIFGFRVSDFGFRDFGYLLVGKRGARRVARRVEKLHLSLVLHRIPGFRFRVSGFSGFGFRVSGFGFQGEG